MWLTAAYLLSTAQLAPVRTVIVSWDGAANWVVKRMLAEGKLRNLQEMVRQGASADHMLPAFPSKTAVSHVSMFSGATSDITGVVGNSVPLLPKSEHTLLETRSGFDANSHLIDPFWVSAARAGWRVSALSAAGSYPPSADIARLKATNTPLDRFIEFSGFEGGMVPEQTFTASDGTLKIGDQTVTVRAIKNGSGLFDSVLVSGTTADQKPFSTILKPYSPRTEGPIRDYWAGPFRVSTGNKSGNAWFRVWELDARTGKMLLYQRKVSAILGSQDARAYEEAYDGFHDDAVTTYSTGGFGVQSYAGGNGKAEDRLLETVSLDCEFLFRGFRFALQNFNPDLLFTYSPVIDSVGHHLVGILDHTSPLFEPKRAAKLWPVYEKTYQILDAWLGRMRREAGDKTNFVLVSDHGMQGIAQEFNVNRCLEMAGLLGARDGKIDLSSTFVLAPPWADNMVVANSTDWKGGIVSASEKAELLQKATDALLAAKTPEGKPIVKAIHSSSMAPGVSPGMVKWTDLIIDLHSGFYPSNKVRTELLTSMGPIGGGAHGFDRTRPLMHSIFFAAGPSFKAGVKLREICAEDIAPTLGQVLGIKIAPEANGVVRATILKG